MQQSLIPSTVSANRCFPCFGEKQQSTEQNFCSVRNSSQETEGNPWGFVKPVRVGIGTSVALYTLGYYPVATAGTDKLQKILSVEVCIFAGIVTSLIRFPFTQDSLIRFLPKDMRFSTKDMMVTLIHGLCSLPPAFAFLPTSLRGFENLEIEGVSIPLAIREFFAFYVCSIRLLSIAISSVHAPEKLNKFISAPSPKPQDQKNEVLKNTQGLQESEYNLNKFLSQFQVDECANSYRAAMSLCVLFNVIQGISSYNNTSAGAQTLLEFMAPSSAENSAAIHTMTSLGLLVLVFFQYVGTQKGVHEAYKLFFVPEARQEFLNPQNRSVQMMFALSVLILGIGSLGILSQLISGNRTSQNTYNLWKQMGLSEEIAIYLSLSGALFNSIFQYLFPLTKDLTKQLNHFEQVGTQTPSSQSRASGSDIDSDEATV